MAENKCGTLPETNSKSPLKMDGWNTIVSFWDDLFFLGAMLVLGSVTGVMMV